MLNAAYYDGKTAARHAVTLTIAEGWVTLAGPDVSRSEPLGTVVVSTRLANAPRTLTLGGGAYCAVADSPALDAALAQAGYRSSDIERWERSWSVAAACVMALLMLAALAYFQGIPVFAERLAERLPPAVASQLSTHALEQADKNLLRPSRLRTERQEQLAKRITGLHRPGEEASSRPLRIHFRSSPSLGPNAFALPDGAIILLDEMVNLTDNDEQIVGVIAHEAGHVHYKHGLRKLLQGAIAGAAMYAWIGDANALLAALPTAVWQAKHSRSNEIEADRYGAAMLKANGLSPRRMAEFLEKFEAEVRLRAGNQGQKPLAEFLASHPATRERIQTLRSLE